MADKAGAAQQKAARPMLGGVPTVTAAEAKALDALAAKKGTSIDAIVNRAGYLTAKILLDGLLTELTKKEPKDAVVSVLAGTGNKGAAALAAGKNLLEKGVDVQVVLARKAKDYEGIGKNHLSALDRGAKKVFVGYNERAFDGADLVIDGLVGAGLEGPPRASVSLLVKGANFSIKPVISLDIPSGMDATTGIVGPVAVKALHTFAIGLPKQGLVGPSNAAFVGKVHLLDVGVPATLWKEAIGLDVGDVFKGKETVLLGA